MKISKVNHVKTGVCERPVEAGGMIYSYPSKEAGAKNLNEHIEGLNKKAMNLYGVFVPAVKEKHEEATEIAKSFFKVMVLSQIDNKKSDEEIASYIINGADRTIKYKHSIDTKRREDKIETLSNLHVSTKYETSKEIASYVVNKSLRESLRKNIKDAEKSIYIPDIIEALLEALFGDDYKGKVESINKEDLILTIKAIRLDYSKAEQIKKIAKSIENKNVPVQVSQDKQRIILSSAYNEKKKYIFDFIKDYAGADCGKQEKMLSHMHYLILLYFGGNDSIDEKSVECAWSAGKLVSTYDRPFSDNIYDLLQTKENLPSSDKAQIRKTNDEIKKVVSNEIVKHYQAALAVEGLSGDDKCWIGFISDYASKLLTDKRANSSKVMISYLCKKTWEEWLSFIAKKYIEMGKGAYFFAMDDIDKVGTKKVSLGKINEKYREGISSFDYERFKAADSIKRGLSGYVSFAVNSFDSSVREYSEREEEKKEDILSVDGDKLKLRADAKKRALRYFDGESSFIGTDVENISDAELVEAIKQELIIARNSSFHFVTGEFKENERKVVDAIFEKEYAGAGYIYRKRFYSNNVPMFYAVNDIDTLMDNIYSGRKDIPAQVPSFNKVLSRKSIGEFAGKFLNSKARVAVSDTEIAEKYRSALYFVLKEIYYYDFLKQKDLKERFLKVLNDSYKQIGDDKKASSQKKAHEDFIKRFKELDLSCENFTDVCQEIMTEYNQQNNQKQKKASGIKVTKIGKDGKTETKIQENKDTAQIYKHYRTLLYLGIKGAFVNYLNENSKYKFLKDPSNRAANFAKISEEEFCNGWNTNTFDYLKEGISKDNLMASWYVTAHFLDQKNLNHMVGLLKNYVSFVDDIERRAKATGNRTEDVSETVKLYKEIIDMLEFVKLYCGSVSNKLEDYFTDKEDYAQYISEFVDYGDVGSAGLVSFCKNNEDALYIDEMNPIPNRNVILSTMYGNSRILSKSMVKIKESDFKDFRKSKKRVEEIIKKGVCTNIDEQKQLRAFQTSKNRLEFVDVLTLTELMNDLQGQLIGYSYLRERDLMYMQLGFYYTKLFYSDSVAEDDKLRKIDGECCISDGAILYQIAAMYSFGMPLIGLQNDKGKLLKSDVSTGAKIGQFVEQYCDGDERIYFDGLCFFEDIKRHDEYVAFRDAIDHFKYFATPKDSIMKMFSNVYDGFFSYDIKLKKSVSYIITNILLSYFVNAKLSFEKAEMTSNKEYSKTIIRLKEVKSDYMTFKAGETAEESKEETPKDFIDVNALMASLNGGGRKPEPSKNTFKPNNKKEDKLYPARNSSFLDEVTSMLTYCEE